MRIKKYLKESEGVKLEDIKDQMKKDFIKKFFSKIDMKKSDIFEGIHGFVITPKSLGGTRIRLTSSDIKKLISDKNFRWLDIESIGF